MVKKIIVAAAIATMIAGIAFIALFNVSGKFRAGYINFANTSYETISKAADKIHINMPKVIIVDDKGV